jgi:hypothetical protein
VLNRNYQCFAEIQKKFNKRAGCQTNGLPGVAAHLQWLSATLQSPARLYGTFKLQYQRTNPKSDSQLL